MRAFLLLIGFIAALWVVAGVNHLAGLDLQQYGILPRTVTGLRGIPLHVFLHQGFGHLLSNTGPLVILGGLTAFRGSRTLFGLSVFVVVFGGVCVWVVGRTAIHIGASGLVFGYFGYLVARGFYERSFISIIVALIVAFFYWGIIFGVIPLDGFVSWEGHFFRAPGRHTLRPRSGVRNRS